MALKTLLFVLSEKVRYISIAAPGLFYRSILPLLVRLMEKSIPWFYLTWDGS